MRSKSDFMQGNIVKELVIFAFPLLLTNLFQQFYMMMDSIIVGRFVGSDALAAIGATGSFSYMMVSFFIGLATGGGVVISQRYGAENITDMRKAIHTSMYVSVIGGLVLTVFGVGISSFVLKLMGVPDNVFPMADVYLKIYFAGAVFLTVYNMGAGVLRAVGDSRRPLIYLIISSVVNVGLNLLFVIQFGMGVEGVAWATFISQAVSAIMIVYHLFRTEDIYKLIISELKIDREIMKQVLIIGIPAGLQSVLIALSNVVIQSFINSFGSDAMAGISAAGKIDAFIHMPMISMGLAITTFVSQNVGAKNIERIHKGTSVAMITTMIATAFLGSIGFIFPEQLIGLISNEQAVIEYGKILLITLSPTYVIFVINEILSGVVRGAGSSMPPMIITLVCLCLVRILWLAVMTPVFGDIRVVAYCYPVTWTIAAICQIIYYYKGKWRKTLEKKMKSELEVIPS